MSIITPTKEKEKNITLTAATMVWLIPNDSCEITSIVDNPIKDPE